MNSRSALPLYDVPQGAASLCRPSPFCPPEGTLSMIVVIPGIPVPTLKPPHLSGNPPSGSSWSIPPPPVWGPAGVWEGGVFLAGASRGVSGGTFSGGIGEPWIPHPPKTVSRRRAVGSRRKKRGAVTTGGPPLPLRPPRATREPHRRPPARWPRDAGPPSPAPDPPCVSGE